MSRWNFAQEWIIGVWIVMQDPQSHICQVAFTDSTRSNMMSICPSNFLQGLFAHAKFVGLLLVAVTSISEVHAQCPESVSFNTQGQVDAFVNDFPNCTDINGSVFIFGAGVTDLSGLKIETIGGAFSVTSPALTDLGGLSNLVSVTGNVTFRPGGITDMQGLSSLQNVDGTFYIQGSDLTSLQGLSSLQTVGTLEIRNNEALTSIDGLTALQSVETILIQNNNALAQVDGPESLTNVDHLLIWTNPILQSVSGFTGLETVPKRLSINANPACKEVSGFEALVTVGDELRIRQCDSLESVSGFGALQRVNGRMDIVENPRLQEVSGFQNLRVLGTNLNIWENFSLVDITGFGSLDSVLNDIEFFENNAMQDLAFLAPLRYVKSDLDVNDNASLRSIQGLEHLEFVGDGVFMNRNPMLTDCAPLCNLIQSLDPDDSWGFASDNALGCATSAQVEGSCSIIKSIRMIDANPELLTSFLFSIDDVRELTPEQIVAVDLPRSAIAADGVTEVVLITEYTEFGVTDVTIDGIPLEKPWGPNTVEIEDRHYGFAIISAPDVFPGSTDSDTDASGLAFEMADVEIAHSGEEITLRTDQVKIVRPPVILVHGTFSTPQTAWQETASSPGSKSMEAHLSENGFRTFLLDYTATNGSADPSGFSDNAMALWENPGGIEEAVNTYRNLQIACTQADVIGHSLGGILPRIYASEHYNPEGYLRKENFMEGDMNRLITLGSTHFGSHMGELKVFLENASIFDVGPLGWVAGQTATLIGNWVSSTANTGAVIDQLPAPGENDAGMPLALLGRTAVPAHAITCRVDRGELVDETVDPDSSYYYMFRYLSLLMYYSSSLREAYLDSKLELCALGLKANTTYDGTQAVELFDGLDEVDVFKDAVDEVISAAGQVIEVIDGEFELPNNIEIFHWVMAETGVSDVVDVDLFLNLFHPDNDPQEVLQKYFWDWAKPDLEAYFAEEENRDFEENMIEVLRFLVFNNDANDGVVRVESQSGEIEMECPSCVTHLSGVLHGFAPRYETVQNRITELLDAGMFHFNQEGFPAPDHAQKLYYPSEAIGLYDIPGSRGNAICQSGMVPSHAQAFARVADERNVVIIGRPVNPDGTPLIQKGAATKIMDVKPKSGNWGPQSGYLPEKQRYSKIWKVFSEPGRSQKIIAYDGKVAENIASNITVPRHLSVDACNGKFWVYIDEAKYSGPNDMSAEDEVVLVPVMDPTRVCRWGDDFSPDMAIRDCDLIDGSQQLAPFNVMATPDVLEKDNVTPRLLTADYDLLMIGFQQGAENPYAPPTDIPFKQGVGQITSEQETLLTHLNEAVRQAGYDGGNVSHHGPENQFSLSPYIDYPVTVFAPDDIPGQSRGEIHSIRMGPPGFRDIHLKRYVNRMRRRGFDLYDNTEAPGWNWTWNQELDGFELEDSPELADYVQELPIRDCAKEGGLSPGICATPGADTSNEPLESANTGQRSSGPVNLSLMPNPAAGDYLTITVETNADMHTELTIVDAFGHPREVLHVRLHAGENQLNVAIDALEPGVYGMHMYGVKGVRFVRL